MACIVFTFKALLLTCSFVVIKGSTNDPCVIAQTLPNFELRLKIYKIDPRRDNAICDRYYIQRPGEWFRTVDNNEMVNQKTSFYECGTHYGIYMQGDPPTILNDIVNRTACVPPYCTTNYTIQVKKCSTFTAYFLPRPTSCDQAYCFGFGVNGIAPNKTTNQPVVKYELVKVNGKQLGDESYQKLVFRCEFEPVKDANNIVLYKVFWYINDRTSTIFASKAVPEHLLEKTYLEGETGLNSIKLNVEISCKVRLYFNAQGPPGPSSEISARFFAGIEPLNQTYSIMRDKQGVIEFKLTVPFGCQYFTPLDAEPLKCDHHVELTTPDYLKCQGQGLYTVDNCGKSISSRTWNHTQSISIKHKNDNQYRLIEHFEIHLRTDVRHNGEVFWDDVELPTIYINVKEESNKWQEKYCSATSDPHMYGFEIGKFESQEPGTYTLYRNMDTSGNIMEIQMKVTSCLLYKDHWNQCACAIAVRAASDVYIIDRCPDSSPWFVGFKSCVEDNLHVVKYTNNEHNYEIYFPSGTILRVRFAKFYDIHTLELNVYPSAADEDRSEGLCGTVGKKVLYMRSKEVADSVPTFTSSWIVPDDDNMLTMSTEMLQSFPRLKNKRDLCICTNNKTMMEILDTLFCTNEEKDLITCLKDDRTPVQKDICYERHARKKRSLEHLFTYVPNNYISPKRIRRKRSAPTHMTETEAKTWCERYLNNSAGFVACKNVPNINSERAVEICVLDILATNTTLFASAPRESLKADCLKEIGSNETFRSTTENNENLAEKILSLVCPNDCSENGICENGTCKCKEGFGAGDCSININEPPVVFAVNYETGGLCDKLFCNVAVVEGDPFLNRPDLTCKMQKFEIDSNGTTSTLETSTISGDHNTIGDIRCKFPHSISKRSAMTTAFVTGYHVSVSNNKRNFSDAHPIYILDSTCQDTVNVSGQLRFVLKTGFCFIHGSCVADGFKKKCFECDALQNPFAWTFLQNDDGCKEETDSDHKLWIIGVVIAILLFIIIILLAVYIKKKTERNNHNEITFPIPPRETAKPVKYMSAYKYKY